VGRGESHGGADFDWSSANGGASTVLCVIECGHANLVMCQGCGFGRSGERKGCCLLALSEAIDCLCVAVVSRQCPVPFQCVQEEDRIETMNRSINQIHVPNDISKSVAQ
jgi:hypothetical protein